MEARLEKGKEIKHKRPKVRVEPLRPGDVLDVLKLFLQSIAESPWDYPSLREETSQSLSEWLYFALTQQNLIGSILRQGRKPVGYVLAHVAQRPVGSPKHFLLISSAWIEKDLRDPESLRSLKGVFARAKQLGVHHWESNLADKLIPKLFGSERGTIDLIQGV